ncbi:MAG: response regulator [Anaerolineae bacterium]|nr:response regulator [Anaerolineae bacterium]
MHEKETILVVDDRQESVEFLAEYILQPEGYRVSIARDGEEALRKALDENPDLIIMDMRMPKKTGLEVLQALTEVHVEIPVILMTFHGSEEAAVQAFRLGAKDYIIKPYKVEEMQKAIERALTESRLRRERDTLNESVALVNRQMERQVKELSVLFNIGKSVTALLDQDRLLTRIVEAAVYITSAEEGFLLLTDQESGELYMRAAQNLGERYAHGFRLKVDDSMAGQVVRTGKPLMVTGSPQDDRVKVKTGYLVKSILYVPLRVGDAVIGILSVDHMVEDKAFDDHDLYLLSALADYAAIALENSRLYAESQLRVKELSVQESQPEVVYALPPEQIQAQLHELVQRGQTRIAGLRDQVSQLENWLDEIQPSRPLVASLAQAQAVTGRQDEVISLPGAIEHKLMDILDSIADGVLVINRQGSIALANKAAETMLDGTMAGKVIGDICDDPRWAKAYRVVQTAAQLDANTPGCEIKGTVTPLNIKGKTFRASFRTMIVQEQDDAEGRDGVSTVAVLRDIDAEREAQRTKDSFIASVSQELRTPATSIIGYTDLLRGESMGRMTSTQMTFLGRIRANAEQMGRLLDDLVGIAMIDSRQLAVNAEAIDIVDIIDQAVKVVQHQVDEKGQHLQIEMQPDLPIVQADPDAVHHVITSLLENALHCSPKGAEIRLDVETVDVDRARSVSVSVTDTGDGVAPEDYKKVFNRYYRADSPTIPGLGSPGVGFSIVKVLVEAHGGRVWLKSKLGVGTTFTFILPVYGDVIEE